MNPYVNEDVMWQRLKDVQREAENRRLYGASPGVAGVVRALAARVWLLARSAVRGRGRRSWVDAPASKRRAA
jgi:hypothetical protein